MKKITLGHHWVPAILARLNALAPLPSTGILAGQAVASAILDELGLGPVVYNDIDVFLTADAEKEKEMASQAHMELEALRLGIPLAELDGYQLLTLHNQKSLEILGATQDGLLNQIWCKKTSAGLSPTRVIHSFDLNVVEVAIDLSTLELSWSRAFEYFLKTRELQVTSLNTPERTLLRYFKKREELRAYGNDFLVLGMVNSWLDAEGRNPGLQSRPMLSSKFLRLAKKYEARFSDALSFDENAQHLVPRETRGTESALEIDGILEAMACDERAGMARLIPQIVYNKALTRSQELDSHLRSDMSKFSLDGTAESTRSVVLQSLVWLQHGYLADHRTSRHYEVVTLLLEKHPGLSVGLFGLSLDEQYQCLLDVRKRAKAEGDHVYGVVETNALPADMWNQSHRDAFFKRVEREETQTQLAAPLLPARTCAGFKVRELLTVRELRVEGAQMQHCVGGYGSRIADGRSRILSIRENGNPKQWSTAEVSLRADSKLILVKQHYAIGNTSVTASNRAALELYLEEEAHKMGFTVKLKAPTWFEDGEGLPF